PSLPTSISSNNFSLTEKNSSRSSNVARGCTPPDSEGFAPDPGVFAFPDNCSQYSLLPGLGPVIRDSLGLPFQFPFRCDVPISFPLTFISFDINGSGNAPKVRWGFHVCQDNN